MVTKGDKTKQRILEVAASLFWKRSYHGLNMNTISEAAGVNKATVYGYFPSKEALALAAIENYHQYVQTQIFDTVRQATDHPIAQLEMVYQAFHAATQAVYEHDGICPGCPFVNMVTELATENPALRAKIQGCFDRVGEFYRQLVRSAKQQGLATADLDEESTVRGLIAVMNGAFIASKIHNSPDEILKMLPAARRLLTS
ncbi:TetR/AcrR family transcriptional regulator [filamentous cyanobacterium LEGE 11480]|uniref:TetR/AcrR family transcriptional regulator n=1 Tax=Romeriopsis navalis LEGE 11480 TaxID=2777977 RepID=A0A928Z4F9_9CYAN|nr:TetR/AcrR family transcriptional regulator [Romeriopsis navalis]MBE9031729.1 TetR/AcrR family transcriptional regulator [Romeriopsis navalis LEGE 11480]